jgi:1-acyl-sn-glycerol-3-phosphate acyltransferase
MPEARVIPFDGESKRGKRRAATRRPAAKTGGSGDGEVPVRERTPRPASAGPAGDLGGSGDSGGPADRAWAGETQDRSTENGRTAAGRPEPGRSGGAGPAADGAEAGQPERGPAAAALGSVLGGVAEELLGDEWSSKVAGGLAFLRRRLTGEYEVDEFGFDAELTDNVLLGLVRPVYERYFRVETRGLENVPDTGGALIVANHSGTIPLDSVMTQIAVLDHHPAHRHLRMLAADLVFTLPFVGELARKGGHTLACNEDAHRLLDKGELVGVWPEGFKGIGKPFSERYKLQRFGRGGFVSAALRTGVPIIPVSVVGAEEIYPILGNAKLLARLFGMPYVPITPTFPWLGPLGMIPLPSKWIIEFGEPIPTNGYGSNAADDPMLVFNLTDQVRETIQHNLYRLLMQRRSVFF